MLSTQVFMKAVGAYVSEEEAGSRLAQVIKDPQCTKSGVYWSWNGNARQVALAPTQVRLDDGNAVLQKLGAGGAGGEIFENEFSGMITDSERGKLMYQYSLDAVREVLLEKRGWSEGCEDPQQDQLQPF